jgi:hypothetical protein
MPIPSHSSWFDHPNNKYVYRYIFYHTVFHICSTRNWMELGLKCIQIYTDTV